MAAQLPLCAPDDIIMPVGEGNTAGAAADEANNSTGQPATETPSAVLVDVGHDVGSQDRQLKAQATPDLPSSGAFEMDRPGAMANELV